MSINFFEDRLITRKIREEIKKGNATNVRLRVGNSLDFDLGEYTIDLFEQNSVFIEKKNTHLESDLLGLNFCCWRIKRLLKKYNTETREILRKKKSVDKILQGLEVVEDA